MSDLPSQPEPCRVRPARESDLSSLVQGNASMALETEKKNLDADRLRAGVAAVLDDGAKGFYLAAVAAGDDTHLLGQLLVTFEWSDWRNGVYFWIQSVYVWPEARRRGVYRALQEEVVRIARERRNVVGVKLYVDRENRPAQATYGALGMAHSHYDLYELDLD